MDVFAHVESRKLFRKKITIAAENVKSLSKLLIDVFAPASGPYLLFHHIQATHQRCTELEIIIDRLYETRIDLFKSDMLMEQVRPLQQPGITPPQTIMEMWKEQNKIDGQMALDFQNMLIFTGIALDDWAHIAGYVLGVPNPIKSSFDRISKDDGKGPYEPLWRVHKPSILWLDAIPRLFRNKMIVHRERPWQSGTTRSVYRLDWSFWTPIAAGWVPDERKNHVQRELSVLATAVGIVPDASIHTLIVQLLRKAALLDEEKRREVYAAATEFGFQTPSFQEFAHQLADFLIAATDTLTAVIQTNKDTVNLGAPPRP